jgi:hypothetical protein
MKNKIKIKNQKQKKLKHKYYAILRKNDNFLHGVFPPSKDGLSKAKAHILKIDPSNKNYKIKKY